MQVYSLLALVAVVGVIFVAHSEASHKKVHDVHAKAGHKKEEGLSIIMVYHASGANGGEVPDNEVPKAYFEINIDAEITPDSLGKWLTSAETKKHIQEQIGAKDESVFHNNTDFILMGMAGLPAHKIGGKLAKSNTEHKLALKNVPIVKQIKDLEGKIRHPAHKDMKIGNHNIFTVFDVYVIHAFDDDHQHAKAAKAALVAEGAKVPEGDAAPDAE